MYSDTDLDAAVKAGIMPQQTAAAFRAFMAGGQASPGADEEHFRLLTGFNDIFVTIAILLIMVATSWLGHQIAPRADGLACAAAAWALAEYFTRRRRMALPSIVLLLVFVGGVIAFLISLLLGDSNVAFGLGHRPDRAIPPQSPPVFLQALCIAGGAAAAYAHWRRFRVPITVAAGAASGFLALAVLIGGAAPATPGLLRCLILVAGLGMFALAMWWDMSDLDRITRRADVAFWLHLAAAPMIVHPIFQTLGHSGSAFLDLLVALVVYAALAVVALAVDRRALLVSGLSYMLYAFSAVLRSPGMQSNGFPLAALLIGGFLLLLSALWQPIRRATVLALPAGMRRRLPRV